MHAEEADQQPLLDFYKIPPVHKHLKIKIRRASNDVVSYF